MSYRAFDPKEISVPEVHQLLLSGVAPRPIAFVATLSASGEANLSPFSFFNAFGANPPVVAFSPAYRGKDGTPKHTFLNLQETDEFTVSVVTFAMAEQASLASSDYPRGVDEFIKAGFTKRTSVKVKPPAVAESPFIMECKLLQHVGFGSKPASGNLMIGEVLCFHVREDVYTNNAIDPHKLDLVARMGSDWYCRASGDALFRLRKPSHVGIGIDALPEHIRTSTVLTGSDLAQLGGVVRLPDAASVRVHWQVRLNASAERKFFRAQFYESINAHQADDALEALLPTLQSGNVERELLHTLAQAYLHRGEVAMAWEVLLFENYSG